MHQINFFQRDMDYFDNYSFCSHVTIAQKNKQGRQILQKCHHLMG